MVAITLGGIELPAQTEWTDRHEWSPVSQGVVRTLGGSSVIFTTPVSQGRPITLEASPGVQRMNQATVDAIQALSDQAGSNFVLVIGGETFNVVFRHHDPPAFSANPARPLSGARLGYYVTIKLMTV
ncbi:MAG: hypothetical protein H7839_09020 [Magnetococcus sp. YQC-5]